MFGGSAEAGGCQGGDCILRDVGAWRWRVTAQDGGCEDLSVSGDWGQCCIPWLMEDHHMP